jgi:hypothetical protein
LITQPRSVAGSLPPRGDTVAAGEPIDARPGAKPVFLVESWRPTGSDTDTRDAGRIDLENRLSE